VNKVLRTALIYTTLRQTSSSFPQLAGGSLARCGSRQCNRTAAAVAGLIAAAGLLAAAGMTSRNDNCCSTSDHVVGKGTIASATSFWLVSCQVLFA
jgi:hypothetical protein